MPNLGAPLWKNFLNKELFMPFSGLTSLYLVNTQSNSKFHPPTKIFWIHSWVQDQDFCLEHLPLKFAECAPAKDTTFLDPHIPVS